MPRTGGDSQKRPRIAVAPLYGARPAAAPTGSARGLEGLGLPSGRPACSAPARWRRAVVGSAVIPAPASPPPLGPKNAQASQASGGAMGAMVQERDPAARRRQGGLKEGNRGSDPRLLGLTMGGYLIAHSGSDPVDQRSSAPRVRPMRNLRHSHQSRQKSLNRFGAKAV
jgi:hypothetical protein